MVKKNIKSNILSGFARLSAAGVVSLLLFSCSSELSEENLKLSDENIEFLAKIREEGEIKTRELSSSYITSTYDVNFFIESSIEGNSEYGIYHVPSGYEGRLNTIADQTPLNWQGLHEDHTFYGWTIPWDPEWNPEEDLEESIEVEFKNSSEAQGYYQNGNNQILEKFIGTKGGPYNYVDQGKYVDLTFNHLVSKIKIGSLVLIETDGSMVKNLKADVTFVGMPVTAKFYPHPSGEILDLDYCIDGRPVVVPDEIDMNNGITYYIANDAVGSDIFYVCPEIDFSKINFKVELNNSEYSDYSTYYGTFEDVVFERTPGNDFDMGEGIDDTTLHAGEMMTLNIMLIPGIGPGISLIITDWSTDDPQESQYHSYPGIYSDAEIKSLVDIFTNQKDYYNPPEDIKRMWEMYGETGPNGEKIFPLFDSVTLNSNILPIPEGYVLDGKGHTVFMQTNRGSNGDFGSTQTYYNIGACFDIYLSDMNGNNSIYIDSEGQVYLFDDSTGTYKPTGNYLPPLEDPYKSYDISAETGKVHRSSYYNNNISGS